MVELTSILFYLLSPVMPHAPQKDTVGLVAAEAAYSALLADQTPVKPKVPTKDCSTCKGSGKVRTGDGLAWMPCPDCDPTLGSDRVIKLEPTIREIVPAEEVPEGFNNSEQEN